ncbi:putative ATP-binding protein involved in virulence [Spirosoma lacussanchae]|uniref:AAA family ATPase n=1 Tax=Spirosoma lacussanchae TaxID=1884249 RepID=UPI001109815E|nr:AAA family ATPase [Spirosoma lacussanchae]
MKITGIEIGDYRQFKNIKFDFTYPEGHPKEGQPLEKVCFIGQSGTGKTTLLNIIWDFFQVVNDGYQFSTNRFSISSVSHYETFKASISVHAKISNQEVSFSSKYLRNISDWQVNNDKDIAGSSLDWITSQPTNVRNAIKSYNKLCLYINDSALSNAHNLTANRNDDNRSYIASTDEIYLSNEKKQEVIERLTASKIMAFHSWDGRYLWSYLLNDIERYDESLKKVAIDLIQKNNSFSPNRLSENLSKWQTENPNPKLDIASNCLNPILKDFFLEVDTEGTEALIVIKTKRGKQLSFNGISTGTKQLMVTAIPIYKSQINDGVILFDEPERSLFPDIQRGLIDYYTSLAPEAQFFFATHSPIIASAFEPCERFILHFDENGEVKCRNGVAPIGDDPNDILRKDFGMSPLVPDEGVKAYRKYLDLASRIKNESDTQRKMELIAERAKLGNDYNFPVATLDEKN